MRPFSLAVMPVNPKPNDQRPGAGADADARLYLREDELDRATELVFLAARRFWRAAEGPLAAADLGNAHYRALAAIRRAEPTPVKALLERLEVRKQSLARVLKDLETAGLIVRRAGVQDRRERLLMLTDSGREAERLATNALRARLAQVFRLTGAEGVAGARAVLQALAETQGNEP